MAESVAEAAVSFALETIANLVKEEAKFLGAVKGQAEQLQQELRLIQRFLKEAEGKSVDKERFKEWVMEFQDIAYDAEDVLESYAIKMGSGKQSRLRWFNLNREVRLKRKAGLEIEDIITKISNLKDSFEKYGVMRSILEDGSTSSISRKELRKSYSHVLERDFVGLEDEIKMLAQHLVEDDHMVVSIYGTGGLGKTTLAQKVYNHPLVKSHFDASVWLCISQEWNRSEILQSILIKLSPDRRDEIKKFEVAELVRELTKAQSTKKIIFVLDDIWDARAWESIKHAFHETNAKILLTMRNKVVASAISPKGFHYQPPLLDDEQSWELLQKKTSECEIDKGVEDFEVLGREMVKRCGGLPLAIIVLGGILATKDSMDEWRNVHDNIQYFIGSKAGNDDHLKVLDDILSLSYDDLPHRLKPCFLYMASFGEDESIDAELLYHMWMAEGLVSMEDRKGEDEVMINVAERYLGELVERCMVQVEARDIQMIIKFESCRLHDIMRDLCIKKARDENFLLCIDDDKQRSIENHVSRIRRLRMNIDSEKAVKPGYDWPLQDGMEKHARSLQLCIKNADEHRVVPLIKARLKGYRLLRVLTIDGLCVKDSDDELSLTCAIDVFNALQDGVVLPKSIGKLYHLRFLRMTDSSFFTLPAAVLGKLKHLQTLDLRDLEIFVISKALQNMRELRYLYLPREYKVSIFQDVLRVGSLHNLEVLENFDLSCCNAKDLSQLTNLVQLGVYVNVVAEKLCDAVADLFRNISYLGKLKHLSLVIGPEDYKSNISISQLFQISKLLPIGPAADPSKFTRVLKVLELSQVSIEQDCIGILENKLPNLQMLEISWCKSCKEIIFHTNGFPQLKSLTIFDLKDLEKWVVEEGAMPNLFTLYIGDLKLEMIPDGLKKLISLKELRISYMGNEFKNRLRKEDDNGEEGADFHKISHIPSIIFH